MNKLGIVILLILIVAGGAFVERHAILRSLAGTSIIKGYYAQANVPIPRKAEAVSYNIYYNQTSDKSFLNAVRDIPPTVSTYTISYLKKNTAYQYKISALDKSGKEIWWSDTQNMANIQPM